MHCFMRSDDTTFELFTCYMITVEHILNARRWNVTPILYSWAKVVTRAWGDSAGAFLREFGYSRIFLSLKWLGLVYSNYQFQWSRCEDATRHRSMWFILYFTFQRPLRERNIKNGTKKRNTSHAFWTTPYRQGGGERGGKKWRFVSVGWLWRMFCHGKAIYFCLQILFT